MQMGKDNHAEACCFSSDGQYFATGSHDGLIEIWNFMTGKRRKDLPYQAEVCFSTYSVSTQCKKRQFFVSCF